MRELRNVYLLLVGKPKRKKLFARSSCICVNNIKGDVIDTGWVDVNWSQLI